MKRTAEDIANEVRMARSVTPQVAFVVLEGPSDATLFRTFCDDRNSRLIVAWGRTVAEKAIDILITDHIEGVLAIVDADFDRLRGVKWLQTNVLHSDCHDMEMMTIRSPAFEKLIAEFGSSEKIAALCSCIEELLALLLRSAAVVGYFRWLSLEKEWSFTFEGIRFGKFVNRDNLEVDVALLIREVHNHSRSWSPAASDIAPQLEELGRQKHNLFEVCCGHDVCEIISIGLRKVLGSQKEIDSDCDNVERALRLAYGYEFLSRSELFAGLKAWEERNRPFRIVRTMI